LSAIAFRTVSCATADWWCRCLDRAVAAGHAGAEVQDLPAFKSTTVDLPAGDSLFPGSASADVVNNNCLACHSADMVLNQPALPKATWEAEVRKTINAYKAPIDEANVASIVAYLAKTKGEN
jgi:mono/diheme cytochrome c family protein